MGSVHAKMLSGKIFSEKLQVEKQGEETIIVYLSG